MAGELEKRDVIDLPILGLKKSPVPRQSKNLSDQFLTLITQQLQHSTAVSDFGEYFLPDMSVLDGPTQKNNILNRLLAYLAESFRNYTFEQKEGFGERGITIIWYPNGKRHEHYYYQGNY